MGISRKSMVVGAWATSLAVVGSVGVAWSSVLDEPAETLSACVRVTNEAMRLETPEKPCKTDAAWLFREERVTWNVQGARGERGEPGPPGPASTKTITFVHDTASGWGQKPTMVGDWQVNPICSTGPDGPVDHVVVGNLKGVRILSEAGRLVFIEGSVLDFEGPADTAIVQMRSGDRSDALTLVATRLRTGSVCEVVVAATTANP